MIMWGKSIAEIQEMKEREIHEALLRNCPCPTCVRERLRRFVDSLGTKGKASYDHAKARVESIVFPQEPVVPPYAHCNSNIDEDNGALPTYADGLGDDVEITFSPAPITHYNIYRYKGGGVYEWVGTEMEIQGWDW